jgi:steroid delta-isomerase-like uncharacterized protein
MNGTETPADRAGETALQGDSGRASDRDVAGLTVLHETISSARPQLREAMSPTKNKLLADRVWEEVWHQGNLDRIDDLFAPSFVRHDPGRELHGPEQNRQFIKGLRASFPDLHFTVDDQIAEGDEVCIRYRFQGTHTEAFNGVPPTGKRVTYSAILIYRFEGDKIAEQWTEFDLLGFLRQLGALQ